MNDPFPTGNISAWLVEPMSSDVAASIGRLAAAEDVQNVAVMPDVHLGRDVCIGTVVATSHLIYPSAVGGDIGCGMATVQFNAGADLLNNERAAAAVLAGLYDRVPCNKHRSSTMPRQLPDHVNDNPLSDSRLEKLKGRDGRVQLGTLGRGNHFIEFQADHDGRLWLMAHSGSRAMGQAISAHHCESATRSRAGLACLD